MCQIKSEFVKPSRCYWFIALKIWIWSIQLSLIPLYTHYVDSGSTVLGLEPFFILGSINGPNIVERQERKTQTFPNKHQILDPSQRFWVCLLEVKNVNDLLKVWIVDWVIWKKLYWYFVLKQCLCFCLRLHLSYNEGITYSLPDIRHIQRLFPVLTGGYTYRETLISDTSRWQQKHVLLNELMFS